MNVLLEVYTCERARWRLELFKTEVFESKVRDLLAELYLGCLLSPRAEEAAKAVRAALDEKYSELRDV